MKTIKFFAILAIMLGFTMGAMAQNTANAVAQGKAEVMQKMEVTKQVDLDFGIIAQGANKTIGLTNNVTGLPDQGTQTTGRFLVSAAATTSVKLTFTTPENLLKDAVTLPIDTYTYGHHTANSFTGGTTFTDGTTDITFPTNVVESVNGIYVFIGATVKPAANQAIGEYAEDITLTATYN